MPIAPGAIKCWELLTNADICLSLIGRTFCVQHRSEKTMQLFRTKIIALVFLLFTAQSSFAATKCLRFLPVKMWTYNCEGTATYFSGIIGRIIQILHWRIVVVVPDDKGNSFSIVFRQIIIGCFSNKARPSVLQLRPSCEW